MNFKVTISEINACADKLTQALDQFRSATDAAKSAADTLASQWEGDAQVAFVNEQGRTNAWFVQMANIVEVYIQALHAAASAYEAYEAASAAAIG